MEFLQGINEYWGVLVSFTLVVGWFIRLESKVMSNEKAIAKLEIQASELNKDSDSFREKILVKLEGLETSNKFILEALTELKRKQK